MKLKIALLTTFVLATYASNAQAQAGVQLSGAGVVNRSFGGTAVAAPLDVAGALHWNPATLSAFKKDEVSLGFEVLDVDSELYSGIDALGVEGSSRNTDNGSPIPSMGFAHKIKDTDFTFGLGFYAVGGFRVTYPANPQSPVSAPPSVGGLGRMTSEAEFLNVTPAMSYQINEEFSFGFAPVLSIGRVQIDPLVFSNPNANGTYPSGNDADYTYGGAFQMGLYYQDKDGIGLGASYKSPQWFDDFRLDTTDENGLPRSEKLNVDLPQIISVGASYSGIDKFLFASDVRYFDYANANGFKQSGFNENGKLNGLGWDSIYAVSTGVQYEATDNMSLRLGYLYNESPISSSQIGFNLVSPLITQHLLSLGTTLTVTDNLSLTLAYLHAFEEEVEGQIQTPAGPIPGSTVKSTVSADAYAVGLIYKM